MLESLGRVIYRFRWLTLIVAGAFLGVSVVILLHGGPLTGGSFGPVESNRADQLADVVLGHPADNQFVAIFQSNELSPDTPAFRTAVLRALAPLRRDPRVASVVTPFDNVPAQQAAAMTNASAHTALALVTLAGTKKEASQAYPEVRAAIDPKPLTVTCTGSIPVNHDLNQALEQDLKRAEVISLPVALIILLAVFGSIVAAILPTGVGALAVVGGIAIVFLLSRITDMSQYTINVCSLIGLGVAIDYSLFIVSRYREELAHGQSYPEALVRAVATAGGVVVFSGFAVVTGLMGLLFFKGSYLEPMGIGGAIVVTLAVIFALTFLPALLAVLGPRIHAGRLPIRAPTMHRGLWRRTAAGVMRRPWLALVPTLGALLIMGIPSLHLKMASTDVRVLSSTMEARRGYEQLMSAFPDRAKTRILVAVRFPSAPALTAPRIEALYDLSRRISRLPHVEKVESVVDLQPGLGKDTYVQLLLHPPPQFASLIEMGKKPYVGDGIALLYALTDAKPESAAAKQIVNAIRSDRQVADGSLLVGGQAAQDVDATAYIMHHAPYAVGFVVSITFVILFVLMGSIVIPIKAVFMNAVSIAASFGAIVWVFQEGHLFVKQALPLEPSLPVVLFCVLFGLSMDYEVLMLSRIKESYDRTGDNTQAVGEGLEKTGGLITSAALIMVAVFSTFALARLVLLQAVGFGMALAVALDATLIRVLLVPATMRLFGDVNWWVPRPLARLRALLSLRARHP